MRSAVNPPATPPTRDVAAGVRHGGDCMSTHRALDLYAADA